MGRTVRGTNRPGTNSPQTQNMHGRQQPLPGGFELTTQRRPAPERSLHGLILSYNDTSGCQKSYMGDDNIATTTLIALSSDSWAIMHNYYITLL